MKQEQVAIVVAVVLNDKEEFLMGKRLEPDNPAADGKWEFLGGHMEFNEQPEAAVKREVLEESGIEVEVVRLLPKVYSNLWKTLNGNESQTLLLCYECRVTGGHLHTKNYDSKISELKFIPKEQITNYDLLEKTLEIAELLNLK